jgi:threonine dehydrogenase-like Zn-dependent dehydrogenase
MVGRDKWLACSAVAGFWGMHEGRGGRMKAVTVAPGIAESVRLEEVAEPDAALGSVVVEALAVGICGTDAEIASGGYGWAPPGRDRLILGHESLGRVVDPGPSARQALRRAPDDIKVVMEFAYP